MNTLSYENHYSYPVFWLLLSMEACSLLSYSSTTLSTDALSWGRSFASVQNSSRITALAPSKSMRLQKKNYFVPFTVLPYLIFSFILCNRTSIPSLSTLDILQVLFHHLFQILSHLQKTSLAFALLPCILFFLMHAMSHKPFYTKEKKTTDLY